MPTPNWSREYNAAQSPEANGFTRSVHGLPEVTVVTSGQPASRRVEVESTNGDVCFLSGRVPDIDHRRGITAEVVVAVAGSGNAGFEVSFDAFAVGILVYVDRIRLMMPSDAPIPGQAVDVTMPCDNSAGHVTIRLTQTAADNTVRLYRNGVLLTGPHVAALCARPERQFMWWGEEGGTQSFYAMRFYMGGPVAPG